MSLRLPLPLPLPLPFRRVALAAAAALLPLAAHATDLTVSAAASLTDAFRQIATTFEAAHPGDHVLLNFGASGALLQQIAKGAPVDVLASADEATMDQADQQHLLAPDTRVDFTRNALVVIVPVGGGSTATPAAPTPAEPQSLADLASPSVARIAIGLPASVPVGRYTKAVLEKAKLWTVIEPKTIGGVSVRQVLDYAARGEVDAAFVYATDARLMPGKVHVAFTVPTETPVRYPIAVIASGSQPALARQFIAHVRSAPGQALLAGYGFLQP